MKTKNDLKEIISQSGIETVIDEMRKIIEFQNEETQNDIVMLSSQYNRISSQFHLGLIEDSFYHISINKITQSLILMIDNLALEETHPRPAETDYNIVRLSIEILLQKAWSFYEIIKTRSPQYLWQEELRKQIEKITEKLNGQKFQVAVMALMKSGKSTLLNAWIGEEYLPSASVAETMRIVRINHLNVNKIGKLYYNRECVANGSDEINHYLRNVNENARKHSNSGIEDEIVLNVNFQSFRSKQFDSYGFEILDTPGTNEFGIPILKEQVEKVLKLADVIIYVLDFGKLGSNDEADILIPFRV